MELKDINIIIPISNIRGWTDVCLESLYRQKGIDQVKTTFIFNGTNPIFRKKLKSQYSPTNTIEFKDNCGLPIALNKAISQVEEDWFLILHNDTAIPDGFLTDLIDSANKVIKRDETIIGFIPMTNYSIEAGFRVNQEFFDDYTALKPSNKSVSTEDEIKVLLTQYYNNEKAGLEALDEYYTEYRKMEKGLFSYVPEMAHFCLLLNKDFFNDIGPFDTDFFPITYFEKLFFEKAIISGYGFVVLRDVYIHHNGNTSSDFFGFDLSKIWADNEIIYNKKIKERNEKLYKKVFDNINETTLPEAAPPVSTALMEKANAEEALFIYLGEAEKLLDVFEIVKQFKNTNAKYNITLLCNEDFVDVAQNSGVFDLVLGIDQLITTGISISKTELIMQSYSKMIEGYKFVKDWSYDIRAGKELVV